MVSRVATKSANRPFRILHVSVTGSTNADVVDRARAGEPAGLVLIADHQTAGRGRLDRRWEAPPGANLLASILLRPSQSPDQWFRLTMALAVAAVDACKALGADVTIKWPNDVLVGDDKLAGILAETDGVGAVVVGIGFNVAWPKRGEFAGATSLAVCGVHVTPRALLDGILARYDDEAHDLLVLYRARCSTIGRAIHITLATGEVLDGVATAVDEDGRIVVEVGGVTQRYAVGDVVHATHAS